jgi:hypothetical protein
MRNKEENNDKFIDEFLFLEALGLIALLKNS